MTPFAPPESCTDMRECRHWKKNCHKCLIPELVNALESRGYHAPKSCWTRKYEAPTDTSCDHCEPVLEKAKLIEDCEE